MRKYIIQVLCAISICLLFACSDENISNKLAQIKTAGDEDPHKALIMLDSLEIDIRNESPYIQHKYDLLKIRLNDKADILPSSDMPILKLIEYFRKEGSNLEMQEVYYYAGSIYRDLNDTPRALEYFLISLNYADNNAECDSVMLRNTYSNLTYLQYRVQNFQEAIKMAKKELEICQCLKRDCVLPYMHLGCAFHASDSIKQAKDAFDAALNTIIQSNDIMQYQGYLINLLYNYSQLEDLQKAKKSFSLIEQNLFESNDVFSYFALAKYYELQGMNDSAIVCCNQILEYDYEDEDNELINIYDAAKILFNIYTKIGDVNKANYYASKYMELSDSIDFGKRQIMAATVNNKYQYHLDRNKELDLKEKQEKYKNLLFIFTIVIITTIAIGYIIYTKRKNRLLLEKMAMSKEMKLMKDNEMLLRENLEQKDKDIIESTKVNKNLINLLHKAELEEKAEDVIYIIRQSIIGKKEMTRADWKLLYKAVDELYPSFKNRLVVELGNFTEQQMNICYLLRIGLSKSEIQGVTGLARTTVWRWSKKLSWVQTPDDEV